MKVKISNNLILVVLFIFVVSIILTAGAISASDAADDENVKDSGLKVLNQDLTNLIDGLSSDTSFSCVKICGPGKIPGGGLPRL